MPLDLRAAGILPVFAAGNYGPGAGTVQSPANMPEAFAVGGTDNSDALYPYSSRGPSACPGTTAPKLTAPAVGIRTADLYGGYALDTGTSVAAPHVAGALALLLDAFPGLTADQQEAALEGGAVDRGAAGVDDEFGYGRLAAFAACQRLASSPDFTVSASPSTASVSPGGSASYAVSVTGANGFDGDVSLVVSGLPPSVGTATFAPAVITGTGGSQLTVDVAAWHRRERTRGTYPLSVQATSGAITRNAAVTLIVLGPRDFSVSGSPSAQSVVAGAGASLTVRSIRCRQPASAASRGAPSSA